MHPRKQAEIELKHAGFVLKRNKSHAIYCNEELGVIIPLKTHDFNDNDLKYIRKEIKQAQEKNRKGR